MFFVNILYGINLWQIKMLNIWLSGTLGSDWSIFMTGDLPSNCQMKNIFMCICICMFFSQTNMYFLPYNIGFFTSDSTINPFNIFKK